MSVHSIPQAIATDTPFTDHRTATTEFLMDQDAGFVLALTDDGQTVEYEVPGMRPNANILAGVPSIDGYDGGVQITERWADALRRFQPDPPIELPLRNSLTLPIEPEPLARLGVRYILLDNKRPPDVFIPGWEGPLASDDNWDVWENPAWLGDAVAWPAAIASDDPAELLRETPRVAALAAIVERPRRRVRLQRRADECKPVGITTDRPRPEQIDLTVDADRQTVVSVAQQALPGWNVEVDGRERRGRGGRRAVPRRPGPRGPPRHPVHVLLTMAHDDAGDLVPGDRRDHWAADRRYGVEPEADFSSCGRRRPITGCVHPQFGDTHRAQAVPFR